MLEKRVMWIVESNLEVSKVMAIYDLENKKVVANQYIDEETGMENEGDDLFRPREFETFHDTEAQAMEYRKRMIDSLGEKIKNCEALVKRLDKIGVEKFGFKDEDYLGQHADDADYWIEEYSKTNVALKKYRTFIQTRFININARHIKYDEVIRVEWLENRKAMLVTKDCEDVTTSSDEEYDFIKDIFGANKSDRVLTK